MKEPGLICFEQPYTHRGKFTRQQLNNEYFYATLERINSYMVEWNKTFEWKLQQIAALVERVGQPVKLNKWQNFLANYLLM